MSSVHTERWVLIATGDGYETHIVEGREALERKFLELHFGPSRPASECTPGELREMESMLESFRDEDNWVVRRDFGPVSFDVNHEDGSVYVYLLTDEEQSK